VAWVGRVHVRAVASSAGADQTFCCLPLLVILQLECQQRRYWRPGTAGLAIVGVEQAAVASGQRWTHAVVPVVVQWLEQLRAAVVMFPTKRVTRCDYVAHAQRCGAAARACIDSSRS
jgi:hypothetical protein